MNAIAMLVPYLLFVLQRVHLSVSLRAPLGQKLLIRHFDLLPFAQEM